MGVTDGLKLPAKPARAAEAATMNAKLNASSSAKSAADTR
jgi:hypothetical protein